MTIGEFYLTFSEKANELIIIPYSANQVIIQEKEHSTGYNRIYRGYGWIFKNGFLHDWGQIN